MNHQTIEPTTKDVLCGRGRAYVNNPGNKSFVETARSKVAAYMAARNRVEKSAVVASMVQEMTHSGVRFLRFHKATQTWEHLTSEQRHAKASHAIRDVERYAAKIGKRTLTKSTQAKRTATTTKFYTLSLPLILI